MLTFLIKQQYYRYKFSNSVSGLVIQRQVYLNGCIFILGIVISVMFRGDSLSFVVLFVINQVQTHPKGSGEDQHLR